MTSTVTNLPTRAPDFHIGEGRTYPAIQTTLLEDGVAKDVSTGTVTFEMMNQFGTSITLTGTPAYVTDGTNGQVKFTSSRDTYIIIEVIDRVSA